MRIRSLFLTSVPLALMLAASFAVAEEAKLSVASLTLGTTPLSGNDKDAPIGFEADSLERDEASGTVTARGHVEMEQAGRILKADQVVYNMTTDEIHATGNVVLLDRNGDVHFSDTLNLKDQMKDSTATNMHSDLKDGARLWADSGHRIAGEKTTMKNAAYTPCEPCKEHPEKPPVWEIKAGEVRHVEEDHKIVYKDATFDLMGVPVMYMPYFSHPDGTITQKSGFLTPSVGYKSREGLLVTNSYYMALDPSYDATVGATVFSKQAPLVFGEYRRRYDNAQIKIDTGMTYADRVDDINGVTVTKGEQVRGHLYAKGLWDIDSKWRAGLQAEYASDDQYLRQYDFLGRDNFASKDVLENQVYVERFSGRDYAVGRFMSFQDLRIESLKTDQPAVLPQIQASFLGEPGQTLGGRWSFDFSTLGLLRDGSGQDMDRVTAQAGWQRRFMSDFGLVTKADFLLRGDTYYVHDRTITTPEVSSEGVATRAFTEANIVTSYPLVKTMKRMQAVIEPLASITVSPNVNSADLKIPNEDSRDVQLDPSNLFEPNRFPGYDRIEDKTHVTYGVRTGLYGNKGSKGEVFLGQSYRLDAVDNPFPAGSGLSQQYSDIVGEITANYIGHYTFDYKFDLDSHDYTPTRHEASAGVNLGKLSLSTSYLFAKPIAGTTLTTNREQIQGGLTYKFNERWAVRSYATKDLGVNSGLRNANLGIDYTGQCFNITGNLQRNLTSDSSGISNTILMFKIGFKNLGEFSTSGFNLDNQTSRTTTAGASATK